MKKQIPFTVSARTARLIGQENFTNAQGAIIELVKNSYDADSTNSIILFKDFDTKKGIYNTLFIIDNGIGMGENTILNKWMKIGTDDKILNYKSIKHRIKSGAKGIGRFALDRLGSLSKMYSKTENNKGIIWNVNWEQFNSSDSISKINAELELDDNLSLKSILLDEFSDNSFIINFLEKQDLKSGVILKITELRDEWNYDEIDKLYENLSILTPPSDSPEISIYVKGTENQNQFGIVNTAYYDDFDYKVSANYLGDKDYTIRLNIIRNELDIQLLKENFSDVFKKYLNNSEEYLLNKTYNLETLEKRVFSVDISLLDIKGFNKVDKKLLNNIGKFDFTYYFVKNRLDEKEKSKKTYPLLNFISSDRTAWLDKFGGIKVFRDDFRVRPYGENGDDWLKLGERQAQSPQGAGQRIGLYRIRPNQISGNVKISRIDNPYLNDKSGREGIQDNSTFELFKNILLGLINIFETDRNIIMNAFNRRYKDINENESNISRASEIAKDILGTDNKKLTSGNKGSSENQSDNETLAKGIQALENEVDERNKEIMMIRNLASIGLMLSSYAHELKNLQNRLIPRTKHLKSTLEQYLPSNSNVLEGIFEEENPYYLLSLMKKEDLRIKQWLDYSLSSLKRDKRERKKINIGNYFLNFKKLWLKALEQKNISINIKGNSDFCIIGFEADLDSIFNNLLSNSINSFSKLSKKYEKNISINWSLVDNYIIINFEDNGVGLSEEFKKSPNEILNPFISSHRDNKGNIIGTGLGMYIVDSTINDYRDSKIEIIKINKGFGVNIKFLVHK